MKKIRILHSRHSVGQALKNCLHEMNINDVDVLSDPQELVDGNEYYLTLLDSVLYKNYFPKSSASDFSLLVTSDEDPNISAALNAGAVSFINIAKGPAQFVLHIERMESKHADEPSELVRTFSDKTVHPSLLPVEVNNLTKKEIEILKMMLAGKHLKLIASETDTTYETVRTHVKRVYKKLGVMSASEAIIKAMKMNLDKK